MKPRDWKYFGGSAAAHLALILALLVAPGFFTNSRQDRFEAPPIELIPAHVIDGPPGGGGAAPARQEEDRPPASPAVPTPRVAPRETPLPEPAKEPEPAPKPVTRAAPTPRATPTPRDVPAEIPDAPKTKKPERPAVEIDFSKKTRLDTAAPKKTRDQAAAKARADAERAEKGAAEKARRERAARVDSLTKSLAGRLSGGTTIEAIGPPGGGGGAGFANYDQIVKKVYSDAWIEPDDVTDELATVRVQVTIRRDGKVDRTGTRVLKRSGIPSLDRSVQATLDRVTSMPAFPATARDESRSYTINFNLRSMRSDG
ncbi:MAG: TonB family protein [Limisphaerales bacterium]